MRCIRCDLTLEPIASSGVTVHGCPGCRGIFADDSNLNAAMARPSVRQSLAAVMGSYGSGGARARARRCADCEGPTIPDDVRGIKTLRCVEHGRWFEPGDLRVAVFAMLAAPVALEGLTRRDVADGAIEVADATVTILDAGDAVVSVAADVLGAVGDLFSLL